MSVLCIPVAVSRWFADGEGWAYDKTFTADRLYQLTVQLNDVLKAQLAEPPASILIRRRAFDGWLVGERVRDLSSTDGRAVHRRPSILRVAYVQRPLEPSDQEVEAILRQLASFRPSQQGPGDLSITLTSPEERRPDSHAWPPHRADSLSPGIWRSLVRRWRELTETRQDSSGYLSEQWRGVAPTGRTFGPTELRRCAWQDLGAVDEDDPRSTGLRSDGRIVIVGPATVYTGRGHKAAGYAMHLFEMRDAGWHMVFSYHFTPPAAPSQEWPPRRPLLLFVRLLLFLLFWPCRLLLRFLVPPTSDAAPDERHGTIRNPKPVTGDLPRPESKAPYGFPAPLKPLDDPNGLASPLNPMQAHSGEHPKE